MAKYDKQKEQELQEQQKTVPGYKNRIVDVIKEKKAMTLVEVIVAFAILLLGIASLYKASVLSLNQINKADEIQSQMDETLASYYQADAKATTPITGTCSIDGESWELELASGTYVSPNGYYIYYLGTRGDGL
ncbi:MAG: prepilin-type N-terminal cleavage/methylation domain-containing protein [Lachnospiraceae bacterium]